ncbi:hypothetical protein CJP72_21105 [Citrobacter sp. NCU1]|uniref:hypothetical protein n=1 Tax=Citrobacter sp. NCU1 TaxID=2026683 RepID=UPI001390F8C9|nr:hypothetical protein [Citrobacter sp. NCU1]NDO83176.1 hypothetical protein [Citrobacter sp. NCU1]
MTSKLITRADLSEDLIDYLNGMQATIKRLAEIAHVPPAELQLIRMESTAQHQRVKAEQARIRENRKQFEEDVAEMRAWNTYARFVYENEAGWAKGAAMEWETITGRNGSEHGQSYIGSYKEPTKKELLAAMADWERWENSENPQYVSHRTKARAVLPVIRKKLAAILTAQ